MTPTRPTPNGRDDENRQTCWCRTDGGAPATGLTLIHCLVVDHHQSHRDRLAALLRARACVGRVTAVAGPVDLLRVIARSEVDVAFVEARTERSPALDVAWLLRRLRAGPAVVLVDGAVSDPALTDALRAARRYRSPTGTPCGPPADPPIPVPVGRGVRLVPRAAVRWAESRRDYVRLHTAAGGYLIRATIGALADSWRHCGMIRIHRSYLVRASLIADLYEIRPGQYAVIVDGRRLPVSRSYLSGVRDRLASKDG